MCPFRLIEDHLHERDRDTLGEEMPLHASRCSRYLKLTNSTTQMKTAINALLATIAIALTASASPELVLETTITEHHAPGGKTVMSAPRIKIESGKQATAQVGNVECTFTPTLKIDGTVDFRAVFTKHKADKIAAPCITAKLGQVVEIQIGQLAFTAKTTLAR